MRKLFLYVFIVLTFCNFSFAADFIWWWETPEKVTRLSETCNYFGDKKAVYNKEKDYTELVCIFQCPFSGNILARDKFGAQCFLSGHHSITFKSPSDKGFAN